MHHRVTMGKLIRIYLQPRDPFREAALKLLKDLCLRPPPKNKVTRMPESIKRDRPKP